MKIRVEVLEHSRPNLSIILDWWSTGDKSERIDLGLVECWKAEEEQEMMSSEKRVEVVVDQ